MRPKELLAVILLITTLTIYFIKCPLGERLDSNRSYKNSGVQTSLLRYGSNKKAPEYISDPSKGVRVLILAYARSGSSLIGKLLSQGLRSPNYVYEPLAYFIGTNLSEHDLSLAFRVEMMRVLATGQPQESSNIAYRSVRGIDVSQGGDIITKTIRLRYKHIRGWIEKQAIKVKLKNIYIVTQVNVLTSA